MKRADDPENLEAKPSGQILEIPWKRIRPMPDQPRTYFSPAELQELSDSIREIGQIVAAQVRRLKGDPRHDFELIDGQRRWHAVQMAGIKFLRAEVVEGLGADEIFLRSVLANLSRVGHSPKEISIAFTRLTKTMTQAEIARKIGRSPLYVCYHCSLQRLHPDLFDLLGQDVPKSIRLPVTVAYRLSQLDHAEQQEAYRKMRETGLSAGRAADAVLAPEPTGMPEDQAEDGKPSGFSKARGRRSTPRDHVRTLLSRLANAAADLEAFSPDMVRMLADKRRNDFRSLLTGLRRLETVVKERRVALESADRG